MISTSTPEEKIIRNLWADSPLREFKGPKSLHLLGGMSALVLSISLQKRRKQNWMTMISAMIMKTI